MKSDEQYQICHNTKSESVFPDNTMLVDEQESILSNTSDPKENNGFNKVSLDHSNRQLQADSESPLYSNPIPSTRTSPSEVLDLQQEFGIYEDESNFFQASQLYIYNCLLTDGSSGVSMPLYQQCNYMDYNNAE